MLAVSGGFSVVDMVFRFVQLYGVGNEINNYVIGNKYAYMLMAAVMAYVFALWALQGEFCR